MIKTILIESILGGHSPTTEFAQANQFRASLGIDPAQPVTDADDQYSTIASGILRPAACGKISSTTMAREPLWMTPNPKDTSVYVLDARGSSYTINNSFGTVFANNDGGSLSNGSGNGQEYYDNYIYIAKNTTIARYGPLDGSPAFNGDYWVGTLGKTQLINTTYPTDYFNALGFPNHVLHRHSDGRLYIADVVGNQGYVHYIKTTKTTVEGDTDNGSTYQALAFGYGLWPTAMETYGTDLAVALFEGSSNQNTNQQTRAKLAFWDTTSTSYDKIIFVEFPDQIITGMKNINGALYVVSGNINSMGFRVSVFLGGYSFKEVAYVETGQPCFPGGIDGTLNRLVIGSFTNVPETAGCVWGIGLQKSALGSGLFNVMRASGNAIGDSVNVYCVRLADNSEFGFYTPVIGWCDATGADTYGIDVQGSNYSNAPSVWWSQTYRIGRKFRIKRIRIPLTKAIAANMIITPKIYMDNGLSSVTLTTINNTNFPNSEKLIDLKVGDTQGFHNFWLELRWTGSTLLSVNLPIIIDVEVIED